MPASPFIFANVVGIANYNLTLKRILTEADSKEGQWDDDKRRSEKLNAFLDSGATEGETIGPTALGTFLMAFPPASMLHRRRMNSFSVVFFPCTYVLAYIIILIL